MWWNQSCRKRALPLKLGKSGRATKSAVRTITATEGLQEGPTQLYHDRSWGPGTSSHRVDTNIGKACCQAVQALAEKATRCSRAIGAQLFTNNAVALSPSLSFALFLSSCLWLPLSSHPPNLLEWCPAVAHSFSVSLPLSLPLVLSLTISLSSLLSFFLSLGSPLALGLGLLYVRSLEGTIGIPTCSNGSLLSPSSHHPTPHDHVCPHDRAALNLPNLCEARRSARCAALFSHAKVISPGARLSPEHRHAVPLALQNPLLLATL